MIKKLDKMNAYPNASKSMVIIFPCILFTPTCTSIEAFLLGGAFISIFHCGKYNLLQILMIFTLLSMIVVEALYANFKNYLSDQKTLPWVLPLIYKVVEYKLISRQKISNRGNFFIAIVKCLTIF